MLTPSPERSITKALSIAKAKPVELITETIQKTNEHKVPQNTGGARFVEERRDHEAEHYYRERVEQDEEEDEEQVRVLEYLQRVEEYAAYRRQEKDEDAVDDEPGQPKDRVFEAHDLHPLLDLVLLLADD
uniref:Uncharacterized protein n=1 Tax=Photinus pyralis TaxID=7054 RepID=A0A1Y1MHG2_PHOPY